MDWQTAFDAVLGLAAALGSWLIKLQVSEIHDLKKLHADMTKDVQVLAVKLPTEYMQKDDFKKFEEMISNKLDRIFEKLDNKADK